MKSPSPKRLLDCSLVTVSRILKVQVAWWWKREEEDDLNTWWSFSWSEICGGSTTGRRCSSGWWSEFETQKTCSFFPILSAILHFISFPVDGGKKLDVKSGRFFTLLPSFSSNNDRKTLMMPIGRIMEDSWWWWRKLDLKSK